MCAAAASGGGGGVWARPGDGGSTLALRPAVDASSSMSSPTTSRCSWRSAGALPSPPAARRPAGSPPPSVTFVGSRSASSSIASRCSLVRSNFPPAIGYKPAQRGRDKLLTMVEEDMLLNLIGLNRQASTESQSTRLQWRCGHVHSDQWARDWLVKKISLSRPTFVMSLFL